MAVKIVKGAIPNQWELPEYPATFRKLNFTKEYTDINTLIEGRIAMQPDDADILASMVYQSGDGNHLELGTLWGGSAVLAAIIKKEYDLKGKIICVDNFAVSLKNKDFIINNAKKFGVEDLLDIKNHPTDPLPKVDNIVSCLIDADHRYTQVLQDWNNVKSVTRKYVMFHDYDLSHIDVIKATRKAMEEWMPIFVGYHSAVLENR